MAQQLGPVGEVSPGRVKHSALIGSRIDAFVALAGLGDIEQMKQELLLLEDADGISPLEQRSALQAAANAGHADVCTFLLASGADPNQQDEKSWTPLHHAACRGHLTVVRVLLESGAIASARAAREISDSAPCATRWLQFLGNFFCGPTPRHLARDSSVRDLLFEFEARQLCGRLVRCDTPRPVRRWRHELRLPAEGVLEERGGAFHACRVRCSQLVARLQQLRKSGYRRQTAGLGFGGGGEEARVTRSSSKDALQPAPPA